MDDFALILHSRVRPLENRDPTTRLWPTRSYETVATASLVPINLVEFRLLSRLMPLAFVESEGRICPAALIGLPGLKNILFSDPMPEALPLLVRAFPLALGPDNEEGRATILINDPPLSPNEPGLSPFHSDGDLSDALTEKTDALWLYAKTKDASSAAMNDLQAYAAFEPWPLHLVFASGQLPVSGLLRVRREFLQSTAYSEFHENYGFEAAAALQYHWISLALIDVLARLDPLPGEIKT